MAYAPGVDLGTLKLIPEASRGTAWQLNGGSAVAFTDAWGAGVANVYTPKGVKALLLAVQINWTGDGASDYSSFFLRKNGSSETSSLRCVYVISRIDNLGAGIVIQAFQQVIVECDSDGIIEYYREAGAIGSLYLLTIGYFI